MSRPNSPRISQCSTATNSGMSKLVTIQKTVKSSSSNSSMVSTATDGFNSAFSNIGKHLGNFLRRFTDNFNVQKVEISKRKIKYKKKKNLQKWIFECSGCKKQINENDVKNDNAVYALDKTWHRSHLVCYKCGCPIGDECRPFIGTKTPTGTDVMAICLDCHIIENHPKCSSCNQPLFESHLEFDGKKLHKTCFICERCKAPFEEGKYCVFQGKPYDIDCYFLKKYESSFTAQTGMMFDYPTISPPPLASVSDSSSTISTTTPPPLTDDLLVFKKKKDNSDFVSLADIGNFDDKSKSAENLDGNDSTNRLISSNDQSTSKEKSNSKEKMPTSKEKLILSKEGLNLPKISGSKESVGEAAPAPRKKKEEEYAPIKENMEDFINVEDEIKNGGIKKIT
uniref:LIM zinc-binding domain-containing protein n=1 Tax=Panagrolaimus sp. JU765 TaxID=591449 RepID=A0AC34QZG8_9BILA